MHICLINSAPGWGGGERMFVELAHGLRAAGHSVTVVCRAGSVLAARLDPDIVTHHIACRSDFDVASLLRLVTLFRTQRYAAVFCNMGRDCMLAGLAALPLRLPVVRIKAMEETRSNLRNRVLYHRLLSAVVVVSQPVRDGLRGLGLPPERVQVIHNGIVVPTPTIDRRAARARFGAADTDFVVAYTGRLVREKGADLLPAIAAQLCDAGVPLRLLIAGDGALRAALDAECVARGLQQRVTLLGFLDDPLPVLVAADAALMPSRTEAFPVAALEALALGVPLVSCRAGGLVEIVTHLQTGLLTEPEDTAGLAAALLHIYRDAALRLRLADEGRRRAAEFSREQMVAHYERLVLDLQAQAQQ